jgi:hypothetical protein
MRTHWEQPNPKNLNFTIKSPKFTIEILHPSINKEFQAMIIDVVSVA